MSINEVLKQKKSINLLADSDKISTFDCQMTKVFNIYNLKGFNMYDFSKKKVRKNGVVIDKYPLGLELKDVLGYDRGLVYDVYNDAFTYSELKDALIGEVKN